MYSRPNVSTEVAVFPSLKRKYTLTNITKSHSISLALLLVLTLVALIPRIILGTQLDVVTDEVIYILGGKMYLPLIAHLNTSIGSPNWLYNYEHPPFVKSLIGLSLWLNSTLGHPGADLFVARIPSIISGTVLVVAIYRLGRAPFGNIVALLAAFCLAVSPWLVYFSALAYLDMTMTALITIAFLLVWHAIRRPWLYPLLAVLIGLAADSKYTAVLEIPGIVIFTLYYFLLLRPRIEQAQRPKIPWLWWLLAIIGAPLTFLIMDPPIWPHPYGMLRHSFLYEWTHSQDGHLTFMAGNYGWHVPQWSILYIIVTKISAFVTIPALLFSIFALVQLVRFHLRKTKMPASEAAVLAFLFIWLNSTVWMFSLLNIVVGTHYDLPAAPPLALAGAYGLATLLRYRRGMLSELIVDPQTLPAGLPPKKKTRLHTAIVITFMATMLIIPHLFGLVTVYAAEGYSSEFFHGEDSALQVAYPAYREAVQWIAEHTHSQVRVGLEAMIGTLGDTASGVSWYTYNDDFPKRLKITEAHTGDQAYPYDYLVWPMHLVQRGFAIPPPWSAHIVYTVMGGDTIYCYVTMSGTHKT